MNRFMRSGVRAAITGAVVVAALAVTAPAYAAQPRTTFLVADEYAGVYGDATITFDSAERVDEIRLYVRDRACDSSSVYVRFIVYAGAGPWATRERRNSDGCGSATQWTGLYIHDGSGIYEIQLEACVDSAGRDECDRSAFARNPHVPAADAHLQLLFDAARQTRGENLPGPDGLVRTEGKA